MIFQNLIVGKYQTYAMDYINYMFLNSPNNHVYFCTNYKYHSPQAPRLLLIMKTNRTTIMLDCVWNFCEIQWKKGKSKTNYNSDNYLSIWQQLCTITYMNCSSNERLEIKIIQFKTTNLSSS